ncbi:MAG: flagellar type III secretion system protein FliR, partial [Acetobacteraceae bacterium]|nr:flagellar type III secretion system protein FliR [Acetobacteraceae bacterium]
LLLLPRLGGLVALAPVFSGRYVAAAKVGLALVLGMVLLPVVKVPEELPQTPAGLAVTVGAELLVGLAMGYATMLVFTAVQVAGQMLDMQMGFGIVNVIDPQFGTPLPLVGNFLQVLALLVFLLMDGHHLVLSALVGSYRAIPLGGGVWRGDLLGVLTDLFAQMFNTAVAIAVPVLGALFLVNLALGIVSRTLPQMNVFVIGLPLGIIAGTAVLALALPFLVVVVRQLVEVMGVGLARVVGVIRP